MSDFICMSLDTCIVYAYQPDPNFSLPKVSKTKGIQQKDILYILEKYQEKLQEAYVADFLIKGYITKAIGLERETIDKRVDMLLEKLVESGKVEKSGAVAAGPMVAFSVYRIALKNRD